MAQNSFPDVHVTGAVHHYVRVDGWANGYSNGDIWYLGTTEVTPQVQRRKYGQDVFNDIAGKTLPFQRTRDGEDANIAVLLTRFSRIAWDAILRAGTGATGERHPLGGEAGRETRWSRGGVIFGKETFELWQVYEFALPGSPNRTVGLERGWYWPQVELINHDTVAAGTQAEKLLLVMQARPYWVVQASSQSIADGEREWSLYENSDASFPAEVLIPQ